RQPSLRTGGEISYRNNSNCLHKCGRSRADRVGCEPQPAGRKRNWLYSARRGARGKAARAPARTVPAATSIAVLVNPNRPGVDAQSAQAQEAARTLGLQLHILKASSERDFDAAFLTLVQLRASALVISADALFNDRRDQLIALARRYSVPTIYEWRDAVAAGGLISY